MPKSKKSSPLNTLVLGSGMGADRKRGAGPHGDRRTKRGRDRSTGNRNAINRSSNDE